MKLPNLKHRRELAGLTQQEVADAAKVSARTIHNYEHGGKVLARVAKLIARKLQCTVEQLVDETTPPHGA